MTFSNSEHTVKRFDVEIQQLVNLVLEMGREVALQVKRAVTAFREGDAARLRPLSSATRRSIAGTWKLTGAACACSVAGNR